MNSKQKNLHEGDGEKSIFALKVGLILDVSIPILYLCVFLLFGTIYLPNLDLPFEIFPNLEREVGYLNSIGKSEFAMNFAIFQTEIFIVSFFGSIVGFIYYVISWISDGTILKLNTYSIKATLLFIFIVILISSIFWDFFGDRVTYGLYSPATYYLSGSEDYFFLVLLIFFFCAAFRTFVICIFRITMVLLK